MDLIFKNKKYIFLGLLPALSLFIFFVVYPIIRSFFYGFYDWNGLSKPGIGMHGTPNPETIGRARSHGCIRLANWDAIRLPDLIRPGTTVEIR